MTTLAEVRNGLADAAAVTTLPTYAYEQDTITTPCLVVTRDEFDPRMVFTEAKTVRLFHIVGYFNRAPTEEALRTIDQLAELSGNGSIIEAVQNGDNWGVTVDYASVVRVGQPEIVAVAGIEYLSVTFDIEVVF